MPPASEGKANIRKFRARLDGIDYTDRPGVYAVIENDHKQIAVIVSNNNYFLPGGGVESGETDVEALRRKVLEEIGYPVLAVEEIGEAIEETLPPTLHVSVRREKHLDQNNCRRIPRTARPCPPAVFWAEREVL